MRFRLDSWQADHAFPYDAQPTQAADTADGTPPSVVGVDVEAPAHDWVPITPEASASPFETVRFVDGVQRPDAVVWIEPATRDAGGRGPSDPTAEVQPGLLASWAAGVMTASAGSVHLERAVVRRGLFTDARHASSIRVEEMEWTRQPTFAVRGPVPPDDLDQSGGLLRARLGAARARLETEVAARPRDDRWPQEDTLTVHDGLLPAGHRPLSAVGMAKRSHRRLLPPSLDRLRGQLRAGQRTPLFATDHARQQLSCYLAVADPLPHDVVDPRSGVVRIQLRVDAATPAESVSRFADRVCQTLPAFASRPHQDARAPQNLLPIRDLERELKRRLGAPTVLRPLLAGGAARS